MAKPKGWVKEPVRHGLASKGIRTNGAKAHAAMGRAIKLQQTHVMHENKLRKAARDRKEYELSDIFDDIDSVNVRDVIAENVRFVLVREGFIPDKDPASGAWSVIVPVGGDSFRPEDPDAGEFGNASGMFEVFLGNRIIAYGEASGTVVAEQLLDLDLWMTEEGED